MTVLNLLLRSTLDALGSSRSILIHVHVVITAHGASVLERIHVSQNNIVDMDALGNLRKSRLGGEQSRNLLQSLLVERSACGELDLKLNVQVSVHLVSVGRHTLALHDLGGAVRNDLAGDDLDLDPLLLLQMLNHERAAGESSVEINLGVVVQIVASSDESSVGLLIKHEDNVSGDDIRTLVTLAAKGDLLTVDHTLVNVDLEHLSLLLGLSSVTVLASILGVDDLALAVTVVTLGLVSLQHGAHLSGDKLEALTLTGLTLVDGAGLSSDTVTAVTENGLLEGHLGGFSSEQVLEGHGHGVNNVSGSSGALGLASAEHAAHAAHAAAAAKEMRKQLLGRSSTHSSVGSSSEASLSKVVVCRSFLVVGQNLVGHGDFLELGLGLDVAGVLIGVVFESTHSVCLFDFHFGGGYADAWVSS